MTGGLLLGIDSGLSVTKAVVFSQGGEIVSLAARKVEQLKPAPHRVERDMEAHWLAARDAIREAVSSDSVQRSGIAVIAPTGHGDGIYLLDAGQQPLGHAIISLDSRAAGVVREWRRNGVSEKSLRLTGQCPFEAAPSAVLAWIKRHEPERYARIRWLLSCKDWLRFKLTGHIFTDLTEASVSFTDCETQAYSREALELFGHGGLADALPPAASPFAIAGVLTDDAAGDLGLMPGTPVATGLHDVVASAIGMGGGAPGNLSLVAGTYSINERVTLKPERSRYWYCRNGVNPGEWNLMSISPSSSANIDWFIEENGRDAIETARRSGGSPFDTLQPELDAADRDDSEIVYHPFLYGSPFGSEPAGAFLGLRGWHTRGHLLRAVAEGVVFNHRHHVDALDPERRIETARLSGGSARNRYFCQLFADVLERKIEVVDVAETGALGAAMCGAIAIGLHRDLSSAIAAFVKVPKIYVPDATRAKILSARYGRFRDSIAALWPAARS